MSVLCVDDSALDPPKCFKTGSTILCLTRKNLIFMVLVSSGSRIWNNSNLPLNNFFFSFSVSICRLFFKNSFLTEKFFFCCSNSFCEQKVHWGLGLLVAYRTYVALWAKKQLFIFDNFFFSKNLNYFQHTTTGVFTSEKHNIKKRKLSKSEKKFDRSAIHKMYSVFITLCA